MPQDELNPFGEASAVEAPAADASASADGGEGAQGGAEDTPAPEGGEEGTETTAEEKAKAQAEAAEADKERNLGNLRRKAEKAEREAKAAQEKSGKLEEENRRLKETPAKAEEGDEDLVTRKQAADLARQAAREEAGKTGEQLRLDAQQREINAQRLDAARKVTATIMSEHAALVKKYAAAITAKREEHPDWKFYPEELFRAVVPKSEIEASIVARHEKTRLEREDKLREFPTAPNSGRSVPQQEKRARTKQEITDKIHRVAGRLAAKGR